MHSLFGEHRFLGFANEHGEVVLEADEPKNEIDDLSVDLDDKLEDIELHGSKEQKENAELAVSELRDTYEKTSRGVFEELQESGALENIGRPVEYQAMGDYPRGQTLERNLSPQEVAAMLSKPYDLAPGQMPYPQARAQTGMQFDARTGMFYPFSRAEYGYNIGAVPPWGMQSAMYYNPRAPRSPMQIMNMYGPRTGPVRFPMQQQLPRFLGPNATYPDLVSLLRSEVYGDTNTSLKDLMENMRLDYRPGHTAVFIRDNGPTSQQPYRQQPQGERPKQEDKEKDKSYDDSDPIDVNIDINNFDPKKMSPARRAEWKKVLDPALGAKKSQEDTQRQSVRDAKAKNGDESTEHKKEMEKLNVIVKAKLDLESKLRKIELS